MLNKFYYYFLHPSTQLIIMYRLYNFLYRYKLLRILSYIIYYFTRLIFSSDIHPNATVGKNFRIEHHFGIVIGKNVIIGDNVTIFNGVTIGQRNILNNSMPIIGNNVIIYKGATVVGGGYIDDNSIIGANKFIKL